MAGLFNLLSGQFGILNFVKGQLSLETAVEDIVSLAAEKFTGISAEKISNIIDFFQNVQPAANQYVKELDRNELPDITKLAGPLTKQLLPYSYVVQVNGYLPNNTKALPQHVTVISSTPLTKRAAAQMGYNMVLANTKDVYTIQPQNADVISVTYQPPTSGTPFFGPDFSLLNRGNNG